jgi:uncharacterized protein YraI
MKYKTIKKIFNISFTILCLTAMFNVTALGAYDSAYYTNDRVNLRQGPTTGDDIYTTLPRGVEVTILDTSYGDWYSVSYNGISGFIKSEFLSENSPAVQMDGSQVELLDWSVAKKVFTTYTAATVYDIKSGLTYSIQSFSNGLHADVETLTQEDTNILLQTYGGSWAWDPRPVWVTINGRTLAASINGMPHGGGTIPGNGLNGQVCLHFKGSATHNGNNAFTRDHQVAVDEAWALANR